jgi:hypothetical protein
MTGVGMLKSKTDTNADGSKSQVGPLGNLPDAPSLKAPDKGHHPVAGTGVARG